LQGEKQVEINVPMYNDYGEAIGKFHDYSSAKFDIRIIAGSTLPVNRWAYLAELKELLQLGVVDDIAVLSETDLRNKEKIAERKSIYAKLNNSLQQSTEKIKDLQGTIETLERQLVQAGIKGKVMQAEVEISKQKAEIKGEEKDALRQTVAEQKLLQNSMQQAAAAGQDKMATEEERQKIRLDGEVNKLINTLQNNAKE
jgi:chromosome segregation ATPase